MEFFITELTSCSSGQLQDIQGLIHELDPLCSTSEEAITAIINDANSHLFAMFDGERIIGCATLAVFHAPTSTMASIEDVVVSSDYRGQHLGRKLVEHLLEEARKYSPIQIHLTSRPSRVAANKLYQSLGFKKKETNFYTIQL